MPYSELAKAKCPKCGRKAIQVFVGSRGVSFRPRLWKHILPKPFYAESPQQFKRELAKHGLAEK